jgi:SAM-dependent methyltransferase
MDPTPPSSQYGDSTNLKCRAGLHQRYGKRPWFSWVAEHLPLRPGMEILDIGCGPGWFWKLSGDLPAIRLTLADRSAGMVAEAMKVVDTVADKTGVTADASDLPFADASFDLILAMHMLYHVPEPRAALAQMKTKLKPGGTMALTSNAAVPDPMWEIHASVMGGAPFDPAAVIFGVDQAQDWLGALFGNVRIGHFTETYAVNDPEDFMVVYLSLPWVQEADDAIKSRLRMATEAAFAQSGVVEIPRHSILALATN